jgi:hypothetical protein
VVSLVKGDAPKALAGIGSPARFADLLPDRPALLQQLRGARIVAVDPRHVSQLVEQGANAALVAQFPGDRQALLLE